MAGDPSAKSENGNKRKTILVVEDEVLVRIVVADDLIDAGFDVIQAAHADEALRVLQKVAVDVLVTDITMPAGSIDGIALAERVRENWPATKVIVLSSHITPQSQVDAADLCLSKPGGMGVIVDHVRKLLRKS